MGQGNSALLGPPPSPTHSLMQKNQMLLSRYKKSLKKNSICSEKSVKKNYKNSGKIVLICQKRHKKREEYSILLDSY